MVVHVPRFAAVLRVAAFLAAAGCASGPSLPRGLQIEPGQRTTVRLMQVTTGQVFTLQNASSGSAGAVYSDERTDQLTKVLTDAQLQALLDVFTDKGMFVPREASVPPDARDALVVLQGDRRWVWSRRLAGTAESELPFHEAKAYFLSMYNQATAYHGNSGNSRTGDDRPDLKAENDRVRSEAAAAKRKLEGIRR